jgi:hypothetical protein
VRVGTARFELATPCSQNRLVEPALGGMVTRIMASLGAGLAAVDMGWIRLDSVGFGGQRGQIGRVPDKAPVRAAAARRRPHHWAASRGA